MDSSLILASRTFVVIDKASRDEWMDVCERLEAEWNGVGAVEGDGIPIGCRSSTAALIREFNCQPYESEPVIDSMGIRFPLVLPPFLSFSSSFSIYRLKPLTVVCTCCACILPTATLCNSSSIVSVFLLLSLSRLLAILHSHVLSLYSFFISLLN